MFRVDDPKHSEDGNRADSGYDSTFQVAASWQANKNLLVKVEHRGPFYAFRMMMPNAEVGEEIISLSLSSGEDWASQFFYSYGIQVMVETFIYFQHFRFLC